MKKSYVTSKEITDMLMSDTPEKKMLMRKKMTIIMLEKSKKGFTHLLVPKKKFIRVHAKKRRKMRENKQRAKGKRKSG